MCDTIVALGSATEEGFTFFGKNSNREPDEAQNILIAPHKKHDLNETVQCTYLTIPQVPETARVLLCQPFWMFGAEMGANEYGVVIGNEAIFTKENPDKIGLTGMDLVRLALERSQTAQQALEVIIELLEKHGQAGNGGYRFKLKYMNSFLIADKKEAYVLETVKTWWVWKKIKDVWNISNIISLEKDYDSCSEGLIKNAIKKSYCKDEKDFNFRKSYSAKLMTWATRGDKREKRSRALLSLRKKRLTTKNFINILRDHGDNSQWMVAKIGENKQFYYTTAASNPCISPFFPVFSPDTTTPGGYIEGNKNYTSKSYWWESERFHRKALLNFNFAQVEIQPLIINYEEEAIFSIENSLITLNQKQINEYFIRARAMVENWGSRLDRLPSVNLGWNFVRYWRGYNKRNRII